MKLKPLLSFLLLFVMQEMVAQSDCVIKIKYTGALSNIPFQVQKVSLPTTAYLEGYVRKENRLAYTAPIAIETALTVEAGHFTAATISGMSSHFCDTLPNVIRNVFKKTVNAYSVKFYGKREGEQIEKQIPIEKINFREAEFDGVKGLVIDLGVL